MEQEKNYSTFWVLFKESMSILSCCILATLNRSFNKIWKELFIDNPKIVCISSMFTNVIVVILCVASNRVNNDSISKQIELYKDSIYSISQDVSFIKEKNKALTDKIYSLNQYIASMKQHNNSYIKRQYYNYKVKKDSI